MERAVTKHRRYLLYVLRHKWYVFLAGRRRGVGLWALITHDLSKFLPDEWIPYANRFYGYHGGPWAPVLRDPEASGGLKLEATAWKERFERAFLLHLHRNPHHHQHWNLPGYGDKPPVAFWMPEKYVREMLADWDGAGRAITGTTDTRAWYEKNKGAMHLHPATRVRVEAYL